MNKKEVWIEAFGLPRYRRLENEDSNKTNRVYPNHVFIKIEVC